MHRPNTCALFASTTASRDGAMARQLGGNGNHEAFTAHPSPCSRTRSELHTAGLLPARVAMEKECTAMNTKALCAALLAGLALAIPARADRVTVYRDRDHDGHYNK